MRFVFDGGHGKNNRKRGVYDSGATNGKTYEHTLVAELGKNLRDDMRALGHTAHFITDMDVNLRDDKAARLGVDMFVSLHLNAAKGKAGGVEVIVDPLASARAKSVAGSVCRRVASEMGIPNRGIKKNWFAVLRRNRHDVLIEAFFLSNDAELAKYLRNKHAVELAILNGILAGCGLHTVSRLPRLPKPAPKPVAAHVAAPKPVAAVKPAPAPAKPKPAPKKRYATVKAAGLNLRKLAGMKGAVIGVLHEGDKVQVHELRKGWRKVTTKSGKVGWVADKYLKGA